MSRADRPVLRAVDLTLSNHSRAALVGPNGVGKSTLLRVIAGLVSPEHGSVVASPPTTTIGLLDQELVGHGSATVAELMAKRVGVAEAEAELAAAAEALADEGTSELDPTERYDRALNRYLSLGAADYEARRDEVLGVLGVTDRHLHAHPTTLSGGEAERVGLAMIMLSRFDLTLLDEPTNNLDLAGLALLEEWVDQHQGGLVLVSHDRAFLERAARSVVEIDHHQHTVAEFGGGWQAYRDERARLAAQADAQYQQYVEKRARLAARAQTQQEWAAGGASRARKNPADGDKHRRNYQIAQTEALAGRAKATKRAMERLEEVDKPWQPWELRFTIGAGQRSAERVVVADGLVLERGSFTFGPVDLDVRFGDRLSITGPNGAGKSTLVDLALGRLVPTAGTVRLGSGVVVGELGQRRDGFSTSESEPSSESESEPGSRDGTELLRAFQDRSGLVVSEARSMLAKFGLDAEAVSRPAGTLSPGERTRATLALFQATGVNLLILDEPTNHLDLVAIEQLEQALDRYVGTLMVVSHDRRFLDGVRLTRTVTLVDGRLEER